MSDVIIGTNDGIVTATDAPRELAGHEVTGLVARDGELWALLDRRTVWRGADLASADDASATCLLPTAGGVFAGTAGAHLLHATDGRLEMVDAFEDVEGRDAWHTPWGAPADTRSLAAGPDGALYVNVHVGGIVRSIDGGTSWTPTIDIESDVHQVIAGPEAGVVLAAAAVGVAISRDGGDTWKVDTDGLHSTYCRSIALAGDILLVGASEGPDSRRAAVYRRPLTGDGPFERCEKGLPEWFEGNVDTHRLAAAGDTIAFATEDDRVFLSEDAGASWDELARVPGLQCLAFA